MEERTCRVCGSGIGGINHRLRSDNRGARVNDTTQRGYALGNPEDRSEVPTPERKLSPASCCIVRALMHCALVWASCNNEPAVEGLCQLVKKRPQELAEFFWRHLERDLQLLGRAINKNTEECALVLHLVLKNILTCNTVPSGDIVKTVNGLGSQNARETWEYLFNRAYIQPVLETIDKSIGDAMGVILNDDHQEHDHLFYLVYERVSVSKDSLAPHLWTYRARITLEHLSQTLQQQSNKTKYPILFEFLMEEPSLRATQYLPDIIRLQQRLYDCFHRRLDRKDASRFTIGDFLRQRTNEHTRNEYKMLIDSFKCAWILTRDKLHHHGRLRVDEEYISQDINDATPLEYLIPTTTGPGACSMALADFLTLTHNEFILRCRAIINEGTASNFMWDECKVPITHLHRCHLLDYEHQLLSIILSHCHYSLTLGKGEDVSYDLPALEKHILDRFIHGKPTILADIPQVVYRQDVYNAATFAAIRSKVKPQLRLSTQAQHEIVAELRSMEKLRDNLDVVEIVIGFLSSGGGRADKSLADYIRTLKMSRKSFSKKAKEHCTLGHVLSLWELLSVHLAKRLVLKDQEPFDTLLAEYHEDITPKQKQSLDCCLGSFELGQLLGVLYEFLEVYVRHSPPTDKEWPLVETLVSYQERYEIPLIAHFEDKFPPDITLAQATAAWKYVVEYHARMQGRARPK